MYFPPHTSLCRVLKETSPRVCPLSIPLAIQPTFTNLTTALFKSNQDLELPSHAFVERPEWFAGGFA